VTLPNFDIPTFSIPIIESPYLPDDQMVMSSDHGGVGASIVVVGTMPPDPVKQAGRDARLLVRRGLADVLEWLGQDVVTEPLMDAIRDRAQRGECGLPSWFQTKEACR
jgi:hypothetical protein